VFSDACFEDAHKKAVTLEAMEYIGIILCLLNFGGFIADNWAGG
jgi:hypothetical protein